MFISTFSSYKPSYDFLPVTHSVFPSGNSVTQEPGENSIRSVEWTGSQVVVERVTASPSYTSSTIFTLTPGAEYPGTAIFNSCGISPNGRWIYIHYTLPSTNDYYVAFYEDTTTDVWVYTGDTLSYTYTPPTIPDACGPGARFTSHFNNSFSGDETVLAIARQEDSTFLNKGGAVFMFSYNGTNWTYIQKLVNTSDNAYTCIDNPTTFDIDESGVSGCRLGSEVVVSQDGNIVVLGAPAYKNGSFAFVGVVLIFRRDMGLWTLSQTINAVTSNVHSQYLGASGNISMTPDGNKLFLWDNNSLVLREYDGSGGSTYINVRNALTLSGIVAYNKSLFLRCTSTSIFGNFSFSTEVYNIRNITWNGSTWNWNILFTNNENQSPGTLKILNQYVPFDTSGLLFDVDVFSDGNKVVSYF